MKKTPFLLIALLSAAAFCSSSVCGATITVTTVNDSGPGSLRQALADAAAEGDTISFATSVTGTITLTSGQLLVDKHVTISGPGASMLAVDGNQASRVFYIAPSKEVTISGLTITHGYAADYFGGGIYNDHATLTLSDCVVSGNSTPLFGSGGGIYSEGGGGAIWALTLSNCTVSGNSAIDGNGGGIHNYLGSVTVSNSTLASNSASSGGAIFNQGGIATVSNSTVIGNSAEYGGAGIYNGESAGEETTLTVINSTLSGNSASFGGAICNAATLTMSTSTISGNSAGGISNIYNGMGGGVFNEQIATITSSTFSGNSATLHGGAIHNAGVSEWVSPLVQIGGTILNAGSTGGTIYNDNQFWPAFVTSLGYNLSSDGAAGFLTATGDQINTNPRLGPLQNNGGSTFTHLPAPKSPAVNAGDPTLCMDQRGPGFQRVTNGRIDIGAVEVQPRQR